MTIGSFCAYHLFDARRRAERVYQAILVDRFRRDAAACSRALWMEVEARMAVNPTRTREIRDWRTCE